MIPPAPTPTSRFNPPPSWPAPTGFDPRRGHLPDPTWPAPPSGWALWTEPPKVRGVRGLIASTGVVRLAIGLIVGVIAFGLVVNRIDTQTTPTGVGSCWAIEDEADGSFTAVRCSSDDALVRIEEERSAPEQCRYPDMYFLEAGVYQCLVPVEGQG